MSVYDIQGNIISTDTNIDSNFVQAIAADGDPLELSWEQGSISYDTGENIASETRLRTISYFGFDSIRYIFVHCPTGFKFGYRRYNAVKVPTYVDSSNFITGDQIISEPTGYLYRLIITKSDDSSISINDLPSGFYCVPVFSSVWENDANGKSLEAYTTSRNSPTLVDEIISVANSYFNNRNDTHDGTRNMVYDNDDTIFDHFDTGYTNGIDCSTFVGLCLRGIPYQQTSYYTLDPKPATEYRANPEYSWSQNPFDYDMLVNRTSGVKRYSRNTGQLAQWFVSQRREVLKDDKLVNIEAGDVVFWSRNTGNNPMNMYRFLYINHIALVISKRIVLPYDSTKTYEIGECVQYNNKLYECKTQISTAESWTSSHWNQLYASWDYEQLPYCHIVMESTTGNPTIQTHVLERGWDDPTNVTENNFNTLSLVCRPDLGSL